jgi:hypothetical protein
MGPVEKQNAFVVSHEQQAIVGLGDVPDIGVRVVVFVRIVMAKGSAVVLGSGIVNLECKSDAKRKYSHGY